MESGSEICSGVVPELDTSPLNKFEPRLVRVCVGQLKLRVRVWLERNATTCLFRRPLVINETISVTSIPSGLNFSSQVQVHGARRALAHPDRGLFMTAPSLRAARKCQKKCKVHWQEASHDVATAVITNGITLLGNLTICISHVRYLCQPVRMPKRKPQDVDENDDEKKMTTPEPPTPEPPTPEPPTPEPHKHDSCSAKVFMYWGSKLVVSHDVLDFQQSALLGRVWSSSDSVEIEALLDFELSVHDVAEHAPARLLPYDKNGYAQQSFWTMQRHVKEVWNNWNAVNV